MPISTSNNQPDFFAKRKRIKRLETYLRLTKAWLRNLSFTSFAVGLFQQQPLGIVCGAFLFACALWVTFLEGEIEKWVYGLEQ